MRLKFVRFLFIISIIIIYLLFLGYSYNISNKDVKKSLNKEVNNYNVYKSEKKEVGFKKEEYLANINIPKININRHLYDISSKENTVDKNIEVLKSSDMPDKEGGNFILASHNGLSPISYFRNLNLLSINDEVIINYKSKDYIYKVSNIYDVNKTGKVSVYRDKNKTTLILSI